MVLRSMLSVPGEAASSFGSTSLRSRRRSGVIVDAAA